MKENSPSDVRLPSHDIKSSLIEHGPIREVEQVGKRDLLSSEILLLRKKLVVCIEFRVEFCGQLLDTFLVGCESTCSRYIGRNITISGQSYATENRRIGKGIEKGRKRAQ